MKYTSMLKFKIINDKIEIYICVLVYYKQYNYLKMEIHTIGSINHKRNLSVCICFVYKPKTTKC